VSTTQNYNSLSGSFRLTAHEYGSINYLRNRRGMNIANIAKLLRRSTATVHRVLSLNPFCHLDNRGEQPNLTLSRRAAFRQQYKEFTLRLRLLFKGLIDTPRDAFESAVMTQVIASLLSENIPDSECLDPP